MHDAGLDVPEWQPRERPGRAPVADYEDGDPAPTGSQRALSRLRRVADGVAAERRGYVRLATAIPPLGVPEGAVVAAFERVDLVEADPITEIVAGGVDPDRSLADHAFARRLHRHAETIVSIGPGPLVVAPDFASGTPADIATRSGRALALQLVGVALARADGMAAERVVVGAYPAWLAEEPAAAARVLAEVVVRRALFPGHLLRFDEPTDGDPDSPLATAWPFLASAGLAFTGDQAVVMRRPSAGGRHAAAQARSAALVGRDIAAVAPPGPLAGLAAEHARAMVAAALDTLERLADRGWRAVVGEPLGPDPGVEPRRGRTRPIGGDAVAERTEAFDPLAELAPRT
jgi:hypothetical protein